MKNANREEGLELAKWECLDNELESLLPWPFLLKIDIPERSEASARDRQREKSPPPVG